MARGTEAPPLEPNVAIPPGEHLDEELEARGLTQRALAQALGRPPQMISEVIRGKKAVTADFSLELEGALGIPAHVWMNLEAQYQLTKTRLKWAAGIDDPDLPGLLSAVARASREPRDEEDVPFVTRVRRITGDPWRTAVQRLNGALDAGLLDVDDTKRPSGLPDREFTVSARGRTLLRRASRTSA